MNKELRPKKCRGCGEKFTPARPLQVACSPNCAYAVARANGTKRRAAQYRVDKEKSKTVSEHSAEAKVIMQKYARLRDRNLGCCSCDKPKEWSGQWHGSHYRPATNSAIRFNLWNINKSCSVCNNHKSGNHAGYTPKLIEKIGQDKVDWLNSQNQVVKYSIEYLVRLKKIFKEKIRRLEKRMLYGKLRELKNAKD